MGDRGQDQRAVAKEFDGYSGSYDQAVNDAIGISGLNVDFFTRVKQDYLLEITKQELGDPSRLSILDVGCGVGNYHGALSTAFDRVSGVDVSAESLKVAEQRNPDVEYKYYSGTTLPFDDHTFDVGFSICVYHHIPINQRLGVTREVRRVLKPGGLFLIFEHNPRNPLTMRVVNNCPFDADAVLLKPEETTQMLSSGGFSRPMARHILTIPAANRFLRTIDRAFARIPLGAQYYVAARA